MGRCGVILTWTILAVAWGMLAREYNTGRKNITAGEGAAFWAALSVPTWLELCRLVARVLQ